MKILFCGDVVARPGREVVSKLLPGLRRKTRADFVIVNGENAADDGLGLTLPAYRGILDAGADAVTMGNHTFDKPEILPAMDDPHLVRPLNYPARTPGHGFYIREVKGVRVCVLQLLGSLWMKGAGESPFAAADAFIKAHRADYDILIVDFHAEATSEKIAMGYCLDGRAALVVGTHTHVPTADARILPKGTGYITDAGMCGDGNSVIGMTPETAISRFIGVEKRLASADGEGSFCGVLVDADARTGLARGITPVSAGIPLAKKDKV
ncbi:MAG: TIGR00282 family metallophosphoesterase [Alphaproteobacteria bacterium]|nr:TIGR00282 family metallophosphoesterase [Alphaproteobacteria bacterium]